MREGLYKVEFHTVHGTGTGVVYATAGKLRGGNSAFAFVGNYVEKHDDIQVEDLDTTAQSAIRLSGHCSGTTGSR